MLLNGKQLADLGYSPWMVQGIKKAGRAAGDNPFLGHYVYEDKIRAWLEAHPDFVASHVLRKPESRAKTHQRSR